MAKYLITGKYTVQGAEGLVKMGGSGRRAAVKQLVEGLGGHLEAFYFAFGGTDVVAIVDLPDVVAAAAHSLVVNAAGGVELSTTPLFTPEEMDAACKKSVGVRAPGA